MTAQTYEAGDGQLAPEHGPVATIDDGQMEPEAGQMEPEAGQMEPEAGQTRPEADLDRPGDSMPHPDGTAPAADVAHEEPVVPDYPRFPAHGDGAEEPVVTGGDAAGSSIIAMTATAPESVPESPLERSNASSGEPWNEVRAMFVDDPRASVAHAAVLVDNRVEALIASVRDRQQSLQLAWQADDAGTEELRLTLQSYRTFWNGLDSPLAEA
jgi:hypothetical protein